MLLTRNKDSRHLSRNELTLRESIGRKLENSKIAGSRCGKALAEQDERKIRRDLQIESYSKPKSLKRSQSTRKREKDNGVENSFKLRPHQEIEEINQLRKKIKKFKERIRLIKNKLKDNSDSNKFDSANHSDAREFSNNPNGIELRSIDDTTPQLDKITKINPKSQKKVVSKKARKDLELKQDLEISRCSKVEEYKANPPQTLQSESFITKNLEINEQNDTEDRTKASIIREINPDQSPLTGTSNQIASLPRKNNPTESQTPSKSRKRAISKKACKEPEPEQDTETSRYLRVEENNTDPSQNPNAEHHTTKKVKINEQNDTEGKPRTTKISKTNSNQNSSVGLNYLTISSPTKDNLSLPQLNSTSKTPNPNNISTSTQNFQKLNKSVKKYILDNINGEKQASGFRRVKVENVDLTKILSNSYECKPMKQSDYGMRAHRDLVVTRGKNFRCEKNKKKKGHYSGGRIDTSVYSIKFGNSDEDG